MTKAKMIGLRSIFVALAMFVSTAIFAQNVTVKGVVKDSQGAPLPGASVFVPGTTIGTVTDADGNFSIQVKPNSDVEVSFIGFTTQVIKVGTVTPPLQEIVLSDSEMLSEVVVTALGVAREKKTLGYAIQDVKGDALVDAHETNIANALTGKVAGVNIVRASSGPGASSKIILRGNSSLTGSNQPLIVVDGIPMDNFAGASNSDFWNPSADMGSGLQDINPEDVESMTVLKGASAAALYGSRAGNGVILITTKKGRENPGLGITITGTVTATTEFTRPGIQYKYGQGSQGVYDNTDFQSWGPEITGQSVAKWDGTSAPLAAYDNINGFFNTGISDTENVTFSQQYGETGIYASWTRTKEVGQVSGTSLNRNNLMLRGTSNFGKDNRWHFDAKIQYIKTQANNRPISGSNVNGNYILKMYTMPVSVDIRDFAAGANEAGEMFFFGAADRMGDNPWWRTKYDLNQDSRSRFLMHASLKYDFTDWLDLELKAGSDMYFTETENKYYAGNKVAGSVTGSYGVGESRFFENNFSFLLKAHEDHLIGDFGGMVQIGGNLMERESRGMSSSQSQLLVPNVFDLNNSKSGKPSVSESYSHRKMNSLYGQVTLNYGNWIFLDATLRNDWTSTLAPKNCSYLYPSVSLSWVISDMVNKYGRMPEWFSYAKARASFAEVGNDMDPYQLYNVYTMGNAPSPLGTPTLNSGSTLYNDDVRNELIKSWEAGVDIRFLDNRLGFDLAWYKTNATNQLIDLPIASVAYSSRKINAGNIQNQGFEAVINAVPVKTQDFEWRTNVNFSTNQNKILALADGVNRFNLGTLDNIDIVAEVGGDYGDIYGTKYNRVEDQNDPNYGKLILNSSGLPTANGKVKLGNQNPVCNLGWNNSFSWKGINLSFLIDARIGGKVFSGTLGAMENAGTAAWTVEGRDKMVVDGVIKNEDGTYSPNTIETTAQKYWQQVAGRAGSNLGITEENLYDATNVRLRNITLSYSLPKKLLAQSNVFQSVKLGFTCTNVAMLYSAMRGLDPESVWISSGSRANVTGFEYGAAPTVRSYVFNVSFGF
ncbi:MAG: SusC/RagA family TonB-linked outer membrane protein [Bacteroidales bacterium]|nr:SusC/RagA family TonB-linked outer membrane protein [Bacteroidales bacterium]